MRGHDSRLDGWRTPRPSFLITIDAEGDNLWAKPRTITTRNVASLPRFQALCEAYGFSPTYLANYEMATCRAFREFGADILRRETGEIGMHLHAWNSPPLVALTQDDFAFQPYLIEYPEPVIREKVSKMTALLEDTFGVKMVSHRAGRWSINETYARILVENGYRVDCSVTPYVSWKRTVGDPKRCGGMDYSSFPADAYFVDLEDISRSGTSPLLEVPMTIMATGWPLVRWLSTGFREMAGPRNLLNRLWPPVWLRPRRGNLDDLLGIVRNAARTGTSYLEFMLHSSELMPGGSPTFGSEESVEELYATLECLFAAIGQTFVGRTLREFHGMVVASSGPGERAAGVSHHRNKRAVGRL